MIPFEDILHNNLLSIHNFTEGKTIFHKKQFYFIQFIQINENKKYIELTYEIFIMPL